MDVNIKVMKGDWHLGYTLDKHVKSSDFLGYDALGHAEFDTIRTDVGEAIYQLKYKNNRGVIPLLVEAFIDNLKSKISSVGLIVPMPPSKRRKFQPVIELAREIATKMNISLFENLLIKKSKTPEMKNEATFEEKKEILSSVFSINDEIDGEGSWDVLLIDDLYGTGASLNTASKTLKTYSKIKNIYVAAFTRKK